MINAHKLTKIDTQTAEETYLEYLNDFLTVGGMADHYGINETYLIQLIELGKIQHRYKNFCKLAKNWTR